MSGDPNMTSSCWALGVLAVGLLLLVSPKTRSRAGLYAAAWASAAVLVALVKLPVAATGVFPSLQHLRDTWTLLLQHFSLLRMIFSSVPDEVAIALGMNSVISALLAIRLGVPRWRRLTVVALVAGGLVTAGFASYVVWSTCLWVSLVHQMEREARLQPSDAYAQWRYAQLLRTQGHLAEAMGFTHRAYQVDKEQWPDYPLEMGTLLLAMQQPRQALPWLSLAYNRAQRQRIPLSVERLPAYLRERAIPHYQKTYLRERQQTAQAMIWTEVLLGQWQPASQLARETAEISPQEAGPQAEYVLFLRALQDPAGDAQLLRLQRTTSADRDEMVRRVVSHWEPGQAQQELQRSALEYVRGLTD
ncbi:MAG: hypothetical protein ACM3VW_09390 [Bacteroidota bacterium]